MGFLDNLENSLKSLESREERDPNEARKRQSERARALAAAPWAERLKNSEYTKQLFDKAAVAGHRIRAKIYMAWFDEMLRLEVRGRTMELRPEPDGIAAHYTTAQGQTVTQRVDLKADPEKLLNEWLAGEQPPPRVEIAEEQ